MAIPELTETRQFRDINGTRWRAFITSKVEWWSPDLRQWVDSSYRLADLLADPEVTEFGGTV